MKVKLGDYVKIKTGKLNANASDSNGIYPFFTCSKETLAISSYSYDCECVLVAGNGDLNVKYYNGKFDAYQRTYIIESKNKNILYVPYLYFFLDKYVNELRRLSIGGVIKYIKLENLTDAIISLKNIDEQKKIATVLQTVNNLIEKNRYRLKKIDELIKSRFIELFGEPITNPNNWEKYMLYQRCTLITGNTPSKAEVNNYGDYIEWIKSDNINTNNIYLTEAKEYLSEIGFRKCKYVDKGSLLMTCIAGSINCIGNVAITDRKVAFNQQINAITPIKDNIIYLYWLMILSKKYIHSSINKSLKGILNKTKLSELSFPFPPIQLQNKFSRFAQEIEESKFEIQKSLDKLETLKKSLMQEYFG